ncbi:DMT family transporter [Streptomyces sp. XM4193]|uniref:DMT family transporter n=1 Tax=Streptomyces sp. XM4193 TaxID=2929782 RepID=UPI001FFBA883|nr:DMT family transporter [Streptomyces sp. XM4193]MCK1795574.1 DMT family transporter [Streptomyces sp. XM4193]
MTDAAKATAAIPPKSTPSVSPATSPLPSPGPGEQSPAPARSSRTGGALVVGGAGCLSLTAVFISLADVGAGTAAFLRCAIALAVLLPLALYERRRHLSFPRRLRGPALLAGVFLGIDYVMWTVSILDVGAAVATVLLNIQVIAFPLLARVLGGHRIPRRFAYASPLMLAGLALAAGLLDHSDQARHPLRGALLGLSAGVAYAAYLYLIRLCGVASPQHSVTPVFLSTLAAAATSGVLALFTTGLTLAVPLASWGWLIALALLGQVAAWILIGRGTSRVTPNAAAALLLLQPIMAVVCAMLLLGETPTALQLAGCAVVVAAVWFAGHTPARRRNPRTP